MSHAKMFFMLLCGDNSAFVQLVQILCIRQKHHVVVEIVWLVKIFL